jgi:cyclic pyranopterin phosphate synthase
MPPEGIPPMPHSDILSYEEIQAVVQAAAELGMSKVRLTGGEPLVRSELPKLVWMLSQMRGIDEVSLTTNGTLLNKYASELKGVGLRRVNVSLDTLKPERFRYITRCGELKDALEGIEAARNADLHPVKINVVVMRGVNDDEIADLAAMTEKEKWNVRFIELMPLAGMTQFVPSDEIRQLITAQFGALESSPPPTGNGPAQYYHLPGADGTIGFISPITEPFCSRCNRMRLTSDGKLRPCLLADGEFDLREPLRSGASVQKLESTILKPVAAKPNRHHLADGAAVSMKRRMSQVGG